MQQNTQNSSQMLTLKLYIESTGKCPIKGKQGDAGLDVFANICLPLTVSQFNSVKVPLGFRYAFWVDGKVSHDFWLEIKNRSGVGMRSGFTTIAEVGDSSYRGEINYCVVKVTPGEFVIYPGDKIAQALIHPFVDPYKINIEIVNTVEELGITDRCANGFGSTGK